MSRPAAVDRESYSGDRRARGARKKHRESAEFLGGGEALVRLLRKQHVANDLLARNAVRLGLSLDLCLDKWRVDVTGADCVAGDPVLRSLQRNNLGQSHNAVLGGYIGRFERRADQTMRRRDVYDAAEAVAAHRRDGSADAVKCRGKVDCNDRISFCDRKFVNGSDMLDAGIVDKNIKPPMLLDNIFDHSLDLIGHGHICGRISRRRAEIVLEGGAQLGDLRSGPKPVENDSRSGSRQGAGDAETNAARRPGHERDFPVEGAHDAYLSRSGLDVHLAILPSCGTSVPAFWNFRSAQRKGEMPVASRFDAPRLLRRSGCFGHGGTDEALPTASKARLMEMHQVRYFLAVSRVRNFTRAAEECNVTQPSLTRAIKQLEGELGGDLFRRERPAAQLTELGQRMHPLLKQCYDAATGARSLASSFKKGEVGALRIGLSHSIDLTLLLPQLEELKRLFAGLEFVFVRGSSKEIAEALKKGEIELALAAELDDDWDEIRCLAVV